MTQKKKDALIFSGLLLTFAATMLWGYASGDLQKIFRHKTPEERAAAGVFRVPEMEKALAAKFTPEAVAGIKVAEDNLNNDMHAKADYRSHLITVMTTRAVEAAIK